MYFNPVKSQSKWSAQGLIEFHTSEEGAAEPTTPRETLAHPIMIKSVFPEKKGGKGRALRTRFRVATGDVIAVQGADLEYDPPHRTPMMRLMELGVRTWSAAHDSMEVHFAPCICVCVVCLATRLSVICLAFYSIRR